jgi:hypothetical protein
VHLTPEQFIDIVDGTRSDASLPHLSSCDRCRDELATLRETMAGIGPSSAGDDVPEPSPLFWTQFSARVNERIDADVDRRWWRAWTLPRFLIPASAFALLVLVVALGPATRNRWLLSNSRPSPAPHKAVAVPPVDAASDSPDLTPDPLLTLVSDLSAHMDLDSASAAGFADPDSAEHAVTHMNADELRELKQLLQAELKRPGV